MRSFRLALLSLPLLGLCSCSVIFHSTESPADAIEFGDTGRDIPPGLTPSGPLVCQTNDQLTVEGLYITGDGPGVHALDNCELTLLGSVIEVRGVALRVDGNGDVVIRDSKLRGTDAAYVINGNGDLHASDSAFIGRREIVGNGSLQDAGNNTFADR